MLDRRFAGAFRAGILRAFVFGVLAFDALAFVAAAFVVVVDFRVVDVFRAVLVLFAAVLRRVVVDFVAGFAVLLALVFDALDVDRRVAIPLSLSKLRTDAATDLTCLIARYIVWSRGRML
ncbi:MAG: hypothetical protein AAF213_13945, partial [Pseudomonadota bacterium]